MTIFSAWLSVADYVWLVCYAHHTGSEVGINITVPLGLSATTALGRTRACVYFLSLLRPTLLL